MVNHRPCNGCFTFADAFGGRVGRGEARRRRKERRGRDETKEDRVGIGDFG